MQHTLVALMQDHPGVLNRVTSLFRRRNFNIDSLAVGQSEAQGVSRMTLVVDAAEVEQITKQLYRLIEVLKVSDVTGAAAVEREIALFRVAATQAARAEIAALTTLFGARVVHVAATSLIVEMTGAPGEVDRFIDLLRPFGIQEMMRTGRLAMGCGPTAQSAATVDAAS
jgi:acetolactate synthase-1/3 small subunit